MLDMSGYNGLDSPKSGELKFSQVNLNGLTTLLERLGGNAWNFVLSGEVPGTNKHQGVGAF
jgi:hypothetical protein